MCKRIHKTSTAAFHNWGNVPSDHWCSTLHKWEMITGAPGFNPRRRRANGQGDGEKLERSWSPWEQCGGRLQGAKLPRIPDGTQTCLRFPARHFQPFFTTGTAKESSTKISDCLEVHWLHLSVRHQQGPILEIISRFSSRVLLLQF